MKPKNVLICILFLMTGFVLGAALVDHRLFNVMDLGDLGGILAGISTVGLTYFAWEAKTTWEKQAAYQRRHLKAEKTVELIHAMEVHALGSAIELFNRFEKMNPEHMVDREELWKLSFKAKNEHTNYVLRVFTSEKFLLGEDVDTEVIDGELMRVSEGFIKFLEIFREVLKGEFTEGNCHHERLIYLRSTYSYFLEGVLFCNDEMVGKRAEMSKELIKSISCLD